MLFLFCHGYLECFITLKRKEFSIKKYYLNRFKKIYLPLVIVTFITVIIVKLIPSINWFNLKQETTSVIFGYNNFWQLDANLDYFARHNDSPFMHFWYISILMQFDLVFPIIFILFKKINKKIKSFSLIAIIIITIISVGIFIFMSATQNFNIVYYNTFARLFSIMFGILVALIQFKYGSIIFKKFNINNKIIFILYIVIFSLITIFASSESFFCVIAMILITLITCRLIDYSTIKKDNRKETSKIIKFLAKISYEVYLLQYPIIFLMNKTTLPDVLNIILTIIITLVLSCILHLILYFEVKNKIIHIVKYVILCLIVISGSFIVVLEKDNSAEMKELEEKLNANAKIMEEKKDNDYIVVAIHEEQEENLNKKEEKVEEDKIEEYVKNLPIVGIGDSVLLGVSDRLYEVFPNGYFDGKVSRNLTAGMEILEDMINQREPRKYCAFSSCKQWRLFK